MRLSNINQKAIINHAEAVAPNECCGFIVSDHMDGLEFYYPCRNIADDPENFFEISADEFIEAEQLGEIVAVVHSHPNGEPKLSIADRQMQDLLGLDFWLVCNEELHFFPKIAPLVGREFVHNQADCYNLFRDFYYLAGADFPLFEYESEWYLKGQNLYLDNLERHGFKRLDSAENLQIGDVILMQVGADVPNHAGIYLGDQMVLHHSPKRLSKRDLYDGYWLKHTHSIWRMNEWHLSQLDFMVALNHLARHLA